LGVLKVPSWEEGVLQTRQPLGLEVESLHRDNPSLELSIWGLNKQTQKQTSTYVFDQDQVSPAIKLVLQFVLTFPNK